MAKKLGWIAAWRVTYNDRIVIVTSVNKTMSQINITVGNYTMLEMMKDASRKRSGHSDSQKKYIK